MSFLQKEIEALIGSRQRWLKRRAYDFIIPFCLSFLLIAGVYFYMVISFGVVKSTSGAKYFFSSLVELFNAQLEHFAIASLLLSLPLALARLYRAKSITVLSGMISGGLIWTFTYDSMVGSKPDWSSYAIAGACMGAIMAFVTTYVDSISVRKFLRALESKVIESFSAKDLMSALFQSMNLYWYRRFLMLWLPFALVFGALVITGYGWIEGFLVSSQTLLESDIFLVRVATFLIIGAGFGWMVGRILSDLPMSWSRERISKETCLDVWRGTLTVPYFSNLRDWDFDSLRQMSFHEATVAGRLLTPKMWDYFRDVEVRKLTIEQGLLLYSYAGEVIHRLKDSLFLKNIEELTLVCYPSQLESQFQKNGLPLGYGRTDIEKFLRVLLDQKPAALRRIMVQVYAIKADFWRKQFPDVQHSFHDQAWCLEIGNESTDKNS